MPTPPRISTQMGSSAFWATSPPLLTMDSTAASGPMPLATSLEPWAKAMAQAVKIIMGVKTFSTLA